MNMNIEKNKVRSNKDAESIRKALDGISARLGGDRSMANISRSSDIVLAMVIIGILAMIILPIGPHVIDYLIALNLAVSVSLLMVALYIPGALQLSIFPSRRRLRLFID